jgi:ketosteroid isomerase-like protein
MESMVAKDVEALASDYADDAVIFTPDGLIEGKAAIAEFFTGFIQLLTPGFMAGFELPRQDIVGDVAYITWKSGDAAPLGTDTLICSNGKIAQQTFAAYMPS